MGRRKGKGNRRKRTEEREKKHGLEEREEIETEEWH